MNRRQARVGEGGGALAATPPGACAGLNAHILPTSANMVGACMCAVPLVKMMSLAGWSSWIDEALLLSSLLFLLSVGWSYLSIREWRNPLRLEKTAELFFLGGLVMVFLALLALVFSIT
jgi:hypothetical protein